MTNRLTRKDQVLVYLLERRGHWVNGPDLANERVGGSEGLKRLRELRAEGHLIQDRRHRDFDRDIWQYRLTYPKKDALSLAVLNSVPRETWDPYWRMDG